MPTPKITTLPTLFSRTKTGAIQEWTIQVQGNTYRTIHGLTDGKKQTTEWSVVEGKNVGKKNGTTAAEQALLVAQRAWNERTEHGYHPDVKNIDQAVSYFEPMLAHKYKGEGTLEFPVWSSTKLDGCRMIVTKHGAFSRGGKLKHSAPHINEALEGFFKKFPDAILDGELYSNKFAKDFNALCSIAGKKKPTPAELKLSRDSLQYWIYDCGHLDANFVERYEWLEKNVPWSNVLVQEIATKVTSQEQLDSLYGQYLADSYEGQMIRLDAPYINDRCNFLLKRKEFQDAEFKITGVIEGDGDRRGTAGALECITAKGETFTAGIKGNWAFFTQLWAERKSLVGQCATIQYFNLTPGREVPRFPWVKAIRNYE